MLSILHILLLGMAYQILSLISAIQILLQVLIIPSVQTVPTSHQEYFLRAMIARCSSLATIRLRCPTMLLLHWIVSLQFLSGAMETLPFSHRITLLLKPKILWVEGFLTYTCPGAIAMFILIAETQTAPAMIESMPPFQVQAGKGNGIIGHSPKTLQQVL